MFDFVLAQPLIGLIHVGHDDGDVLKPAIVAAGVHRHRSSFGREILRELDRLASELHPNDSRADPEQPLQPLVIEPRHLDIGSFLER